MIKLLMIDMMQGGRKREDELFVQAHASQIKALICAIARKFDLSFWHDQPADRADLTVSIELVDEHWNILVRAASDQCYLADRRQPDPGAVAVLLTGFCARYGLDMEFMSQSY